MEPHATKAHNMQITKNYHAGLIEEASFEIVYGQTIYCVTSTFGCEVELAAMLEYLAIENVLSILDKMVITDLYGNMHNESKNR